MNESTQTVFGGARIEVQYTGTRIESQTNQIVTQKRLILH